MREFPRKFLSLRDKNGSHRRSKSVPPTPKDTKSRPLSTDVFRAIFKMDHLRQNPKSGADKEVDDSKVEEAQRRLGLLEISNVSTDHIRDIMATKFVDGDPAKAAEFIDIEQKAAAGVIVPYDPAVRMLGAENREGVTCYLDALLFAMFSKLDAFECMLSNDFPQDEPKRRLVNLLRIWVNMLRTGKLIHVDLTKLIQEALADCGWQDARSAEQQDTSEAFAFLTETLQLPLLSLQVDLFHQGKKDKDDHKVVYERLLNLAVPSDPEGKEIRLEDCLEEYFNARVDVLRDSEVGKKSSPDERWSDEKPTVTHHDTFQLVRGDDVKPSSTAPTLLARPQTSKSHLSRELDDGDAISGQTTVVLDDGKEKHLQTLPPARRRSTSVIQRVLVDERSRPTSGGSSSRKAKHKGSTVVKAITIPAWQFFRLIPWHALASSEPRNDIEVAMNFDQRPIVGICLKRYAMSESGQPQRRNAYIDIPDSLRLPYFMLAGRSDLDDDNGLNTEYKLVLQSVVCHRGDSLHSGHYISFTRVAPKLLIGNRRHYFDPPPDYEEAQWVRFDDLEVESRVTYVDNIKQSLKEEMPYLLFYQIVPMVDLACPSCEGTEVGLPSYNESRTSFEVQSSGSTHEGDVAGVNRILSGYRDDAPVSEMAGPSNPASVRLSSEAEMQPATSSERPLAGVHSWSTPDGSRRQSMVQTESGAATPAITSDAPSPVIGPSDESVASSRLSRAASRFALGRQSRSASQSGEARISFSMTRLGGLMKSSKEPLTDAGGLMISASSSTGPLYLDTPTHGPDSPLEGDKEAGQGSHGTPSSKRKSSKSKDKAAKHKPGTQPERVCALM